MKKKQTFWFFLILIMILIAVFSAAVRSNQRVEKVNYLDHLEDKILTVDDVDYPLSFLAFYLAYEEREVQKQAVVYDPIKPLKYWNMFTDGMFIKNKAKQVVLDLAIHDIIFYEIGVEETVVLTQTERDFLTNQQNDFWEDLTLEQREWIGVSREEINMVLERMAIAQKMQRYMADEANRANEEFEIGGEEYSALLETHHVQIEEKLWERIDFGNITLRNSTSTP